MALANPAIISDAPARPFEARLFWVIFAAALVIGGIAAIYYARLELTLSHYDARAHLVVARRITDSLTPGWRQIGAVWLPLPHLLNMFPAEIDWNYRNGYLSTGMSVLSLAAGLASLARFLYRRTGVAVAAAVAPLIILLNPNVLYLQSTPMTEALLFGLSGLAVERVDAWIGAASAGRRWMAGLTLAALFLTRYEGWFIGSALIALSIVIQLRRGRSRRTALALTPFAAAAIAGFLILSWGSTGRWFVSSGFFVSDPRSYHHIGVVLQDIFQSSLALGGWTLLLAGAAGVLVAAGRASNNDRSILVLSLLGAIVLPLVAFYQGHPLRIRYMIPLIVAAGAASAFALQALSARARWGLGVALVVAISIERPPLDATAPMVVEAQWETPFRLERQRVTASLRAIHDGTPILASMGSLGHYMQEASASGFGLRDFVHEGNGDLWTQAVAAPGRHVRWILIEERAEGGDVLARHAAEDPEFLSEFSRAAEGGGLVLYQKK